MITISPVESNSSLIREIRRALPICPCHRLRIDGKSSNQRIIIIAGTIRLDTIHNGTIRIIITILRIVQRSFNVKPKNSIYIQIRVNFPYFRSIKSNSTSGNFFRPTYNIGLGMEYQKPHTENENYRPFPLAHSFLTFFLHTHTIQGHFVQSLVREIKTSNSPPSRDNIHALYY
ncbi:hypothetical protein DSECCO2_60740 [anaerobic digester metagenome]